MGAKNNHAIIIIQPFLKNFMLVIIIQKKNFIKIIPCTCFFIGELDVPFDITDFVKSIFAVLLSAFVCIPIELPLSLILDNFFRNF
jgi:hypothetical protein